ncbi:MAG: catechol 2,3-dioxygenase [Chloroflexi bacterium]|nr:catechol 2,3-dioxygenase [Chloroflexota bacterium]
MGVLKLGYLQLRVADLEQSVRYYTQVLGLKETDRTGGKVYLKAWDELEHHQIVLKQGDPGMDYMSFRVDSSDDLVEFENRLERSDHHVQRISAGEEHALGEAIRFTAPSNHTVELYYQQPHVGNGLPNLNPQPYPDDLVGIHPPRMDHTLLTTPDAKESLDFWREIMGFRLTEQVVDPTERPIAVWLERTHTPHDLAFIPGNPGGFHHVAFWLDDWNEIGRAAEVLARGGAKIDAGPTRHGITRGHTIYFFDPSGNRNEVFTGGYWADPAMKPITWSSDELWTGIFYWDRTEKGSFVENYT